MSKVMTLKHPRWGEFIERLEGPEGCNFHEQEPGNPNSVTWTCKAGTDKSLATAILEDMGDVSIKKSMIYFENHGGCCDCEILFNVVP